MSLPWFLSKGFEMSAIIDGKNDRSFGWILRCYHLNLWVKTSTLLFESCVVLPRSINSQPAHLTSHFMKFLRIPLRLQPKLQIPNLLNLLLIIMHNITPMCLIVIWKVENLLTEHLEVIGMGIILMPIWRQWFSSILLDLMRCSWLKHDVWEMQYNYFYYLIMYLSMDNNK